MPTNILYFTFYYENLMNKHTIFPNKFVALLTNWQQTNGDLSHDQLFLNISFSLYLSLFHSLHFSFTTTSTSTAIVKHTSITIHNHNRHDSQSTSTKAFRKSTRVIFSLSQRSLLKHLYLIVLFSKFHVVTQKLKKAGDHQA